MAAKPKDYVVTGLYVTCKTMTQDGVRVVGLYQGAPLPADVPQEDLDHLLKMGLVHERGWTEPDPADTSALTAASYAAGLLAQADAELAKAQKARDDAKAGVDRNAAFAAEQARAAAEEAAAAQAAADAEKAAAEQADADARKAAEAEAAALAKPSKAAAARAAKA